MSLYFPIGIMAGSPCPIEIMKKVINDMNCPEMTVRDFFPIYDIIYFYQIGCLK